MEGRQWTWLLFLLGVTMALWFYTGTHLIHQTNQDRMASDQQHNMTLAGQQRGDLWPTRTDGVVNPLWPWLASAFHTESERRFFVRGKWVNLTVTAFFMTGLILVLAARGWSLGSLTALLLAGGLGALLPRAVFFQPEPLYYIFFFLSWMVAISLLFRNPWWGYPVLGVLLGLAWLAKTSAMPLLLLFLAVSGLRFFQQLLWPQLAPAALRSWSWRRHLAGIALALIAMGAVIAPRAHHAWSTYGDPFHSWPSYWMWQESFSEESVPFMVQYGSREALRNLAPENRPSFRNYVAEHGWERFRERLWEGSREAWQRFVFPEQRWRDRLNYRPWREPLLFRGFYLAAPFALAMVLWVLVPKRRRPWFELVFGGLFVVGGLIGYTMAYGWYEPIGRGDRFMLSLYLPLLYSGYLAVERLRREGANVPARLVVTAASLLIAATLLWRIAELLVYPDFR